jgi:hypothetical protein
MIKEKMKMKEEVIAVLRNVKTGKKKVIRERWYHKFLRKLR